MLPVELARVDALLDDPVFFASFESYFDARIGRPSIPMETYLRLMFLKFRYRLGTSRCVGRWATRSLGSGSAGSRSDPGAASDHVDEDHHQMWGCGGDRLNEALLAESAQAKLLRTDKVRADTTVVEADVAYPTDLGLLAKAVGKIARTVERIKAVGGATRTRAQDRRRAAGRRARSIAGKLKLRGAQQRDEAQASVQRITGELAGLAEAAMRDAAAVVRNAKRALRRATGQRQGQLRRAINELDTIIERATRVVAQTRSRLAGVMPESASRLVSLHDTDARPIRKGRLGKPVEFGYKAQIVDNADGVILDHNIEIGNPPDAPQLAPAIERIARRTGRAPRAVTADRGTAKPVSKPSCTISVSATSPFLARANPVPLAASSSTGEPSARRSNGAPDPKDGSTTSNAATDGPHRTDHHSRPANMVRTRRIRPQPGQDRGAGSMNGAPDESRGLSTPHRTAAPSGIGPALTRTHRFSGRSS